MAFATLNGVRLHYQVSGAGPSLLLIHGLGSSGADWAFQVRDLACRFTLIAPDMRGSGLSDAPHARYSIAGFASDLWALLDHLGVTSIGILGFSMGGAVALEMALQHPARVSKVMTINSLPSYRVNTMAKLLEVYGQQVLVRTLGLKRVAKMVGARLFPDSHQHAMRARVIDVLGAQPLKPYLNTVRALAGWCVLPRAELLRTQVQVLMLVAERDYTPLAEKHALAERIGAQILTVQGSRHGTPFDSILATNLVGAAWFSGADLAEIGSLSIDTAEQAPTTPP